MNSHDALLALALLGALSASGTAAAQLPPSEALKIALPGDHTDVMPTLRSTRLVTFRWTPDRSFVIRALVGAYVNVELPEGETIQGYYPSDPASFESTISGDNRRVMIKATEPDKIATATLVSNARSYELTQISVSPGQPWFQRVRWELPSPTNGIYEAGQATHDGAPAQMVIDPEKLNSNYRVRKVKGRAKFVPQAVFDSGTHTWIRFGSIQDMPAVFAESSDGMELLNFSTPDDGQNTILIPSVHDVLVLRLGKQEVRLERGR